MIALPQIYILAGVIFALFALLGAGDATNPKRRFTAIFWMLLAIEMIFGDRFSDLENGMIVLAMVAIAGFGGLGRGLQSDGSVQRAERAKQHGNRLFLLALVIPATALIGSFAFKALPDLVDPKQATLVSLALGTLLALGIGLVWLRERPLAAMHEGRRLMDAVGWAALLPQMLASLGAVFAIAGVGKVVGDLVAGVIPADSRLAAVAAYGLGMALFTMVMGNAFAAFPVMMAAVGMPLLIGHYHGDPAVVAAVGMLAGFCGTLMTPMAANFNIVPAALLDLKDRNAVVKAQVPTALPLLAFNIALIAWAAFS